MPTFAGVVQSGMGHGEEASAIHTANDVVQQAHGPPSRKDTVSIDKEHDEEHHGEHDHVEPGEIEGSTVGQAPKWTATVLSDNGDVVESEHQEDILICNVILSRQCV